MASYEPTFLPRERAATPFVADYSRVTVPLLTSNGASAVVEFRIRRDVVEVWRLEHRAGAVARRRLQQWIADPQDPLQLDEVTLTWDETVDARGRIAVSLPDVSAWTLMPEALDRLRTSVHQKSG